MIASEYSKSRAFGHRIEISRYPSSQLWPLAIMVTYYTMFKVLCPNSAAYCASLLMELLMLANTVQCRVCYCTVQSTLLYSAEYFIVLCNVHNCMWRVLYCTLQSMLLCSAEYVIVHCRVCYCTVQSTLVSVQCRVL